jgi:predicted small lipoprotein YifL
MVFVFVPLCCFLLVFLTDAARSFALPQDPPLRPDGTPSAVCVWKPHSKASAMTSEILIEHVVKPLSSGRLKDGGVIFIDDSPAHTSYAVESVSSETNIDIDVLAAKLTGDMQLPDLWTHFELRHYFNKALVARRAADRFREMTEAEWQSLAAEIIAFAWWQGIQYSLANCGRSGGLILPPPSSEAAARADPRNKIFDLGGGVSFSAADAIALGDCDDWLLQNVVVRQSLERSARAKAAAAAKKQAKEQAAMASASSSASPAVSASTSAATASSGSASSSPAAVAATSTADVASSAASAVSSSLAAVAAASPVSAPPLPAGDGGDSMQIDRPLRRSRAGIGRRRKTSSAPSSAAADAGTFLD